MLDKSEIIEIHREDDEKSRIIMDQIREGNITDEGEIRALVGTFEFTSKRTKQHIEDSIVYLSKKGILEPDYPEIKSIRLKIVV